MRSFPLGILAAIGLATSACAQEAPAAGLSPWIVLVSNDRITASLDTTSVRRDSATTHVLVRFDYAQPQKVPGGAGSFNRMETHLAVHCDAREARNLDMRLIVDAAPNEAEPPFVTMDEQAWQSFDAHGLTPYLFDPLCQHLKAGA